MAANNTHKKELVQKLEELTIQELIDQIESGEATASHLSVARQILRDNQQLLLAADPSAPITELVGVLPFAEAAEG